MTIGENIRRFRKEKGLTQKELAEATGIAEITIRDYEKGKYEPKRERLDKLSDALTVSTIDLLSKTEKAPDEAGDQFKKDYRNKDYITEREEPQMERTIEVSIDRYEELVANEEKLEIVKNLFALPYVSDDIIRIVLGMLKEEKHEG